MTENLKNGGKGDAVKALQDKLAKLGFPVANDGTFGGKTEAAVKEMQLLFGYTVDGIVGPGTMGLIDAQIGYGWSLSLPDAKQRALTSQGKGVPAKAGAPTEAGKQNAPIKK